MTIKDLRSIGRRLRREIPSIAEKFRTSEPLGRGASGDMTYPVDKKAEDIIFEEVEKLNVPLTVISEEYGVKDIHGGGVRLLIDPIDGSKNALSGVPLFCTSMALIEGETIEHARAGYIVNLVNGDEFWAVKGEGCFFNEIPAETQKDDALRVILYEAQRPETDIPCVLPVLSLFRRARCLGSIALDMALLSRGSASMFITPTPSRSFDFAAGYLLVKEAGGIITDLNGGIIDKIPVGVTRVSPLLASGNEKLHKKALEVLKG